MSRSTFLGIILFFASTLSAAPVTTTGIFVFQGGRSVTDGHIRFDIIGKDPLDQRIELWMTPSGSAQPIHDYAVEMTKKLHVVIVDSGFTTFLHIHPTLGKDGIFRIEQRFPAPGVYYLYADGAPNNGDHQVFRFTMNIGGDVSPRKPVLEPTGREVNVGPYTVDLSKARLSAGGMDMIDVEILKGDKLAKDLHPYLGAPAHAVFLNSHDLTYVHVHPMPEGDNTPMTMAAMNMELPDSASLPATMMLHVSVKEPGLYKMWLQFRGGDQLYIAPFVLPAE